MANINTLNDGKRTKKEAITLREASDGFENPKELSIIESSAIFHLMESMKADRTIIFISKKTEENENFSDKYYYSSPAFNHLGNKDFHTTHIHNLDKILLKYLSKTKPENWTQYSKSNPGLPSEIHNFMKVMEYDSILTGIISDRDGKVATMVMGTKNGSLLENEGLISICERLLKKHINYSTTTKEGPAGKLQAHLERNEQFIKNLVNNLNHEIRSPMNAIIGFLDFIQEDTELSQIESDTYKEAIRSSCYRLMDTIDNLVEFTMLQTNQKTPIIKKDVDIKEIIMGANSIIECESKYLQAEVSYKFSGNDFTYSTDYQMIKEIVKHLTKNALSFSQTPKIEIFLQGFESFFEISISDNGIGMNKENLEHIFEPFYQVEYGFSRSYAGLGLGLALVKGYTKLLGGEILAESTLGKGTKISVVIPAKKERKKF